MELKIGNYASYINVTPETENTKVAYTKELCGNIYIDYDKEHNVLGIEFLAEIKPGYYDDYKSSK